MIFVTVGAQMPFERLVSAVDDWAAVHGRSDVFAQIGPTEWRPRHIEWVHFLDPAEFRLRCRAAKFIVAHAGMGAIITALECGKPILVMPRHGDLQETRNDHQLATARYFRKREGVWVAFNETELVARLDHSDAFVAAPRIGSYASPSLLAAIGSFLNGSSAGSRDERVAKHLQKQVGCGKRH